MSAGAAGQEPEVRFDTTRGVVIVVPRGVVGTRHVTRLIDAYLDDPAFRPGSPILWDLRQADLTRLRVEEVNALRGEILARLERRGAGRTALVADDDLSYALGRMYEQIRSLADAPVGVFRDRDAAFAWLADPPGGND